MEKNHTTILEMLQQMNGQQAAGSGQQAAGSGEQAAGSGQQTAVRGMAKGKGGDEDPEPLPEPTEEEIIDNYVRELEYLVPSHQGMLGSLFKVLAVTFKSIDDSFEELYNDGGGEPIEVPDKTGVVSWPGVSE